MTLSASIRQEAVDLLNAKYPHVPPTTLHDIVELLAPVLAEGLMREVEEAQASLALYSRAMERGRALYHERHPDRRDVWPDAGEQWYDLLDHLAALRQERDKLDYDLFHATQRASCFCGELAEVDRPCEVCTLKSRAEAAEAQLAAARGLVAEMAAAHICRPHAISSTSLRNKMQAVIDHFGDGRPG